MGFFYRTIRMVDHGIKPCYIFDGKPPELKGGVVSYLAGLAVHQGRLGDLEGSADRLARQAVRNQGSCQGRGGGGKGDG